MHVADIWTAEVWTVDVWVADVWTVDVWVADVWVTDVWAADVCIANFEIFFFRSEFVFKICSECSADPKETINFFERTNFFGRNFF